MSGTICDLNFSYLYDTNRKSFTSNLENRLTSLQQKNIVTLSAVRDNQYALDVNYNNLPVGAFTTALISCLNKLNFNVTLNTLISSIYVFLISNNYSSMSPVITSNKSIDLTKTFFLSTKLFETPGVQPVQQPIPQQAPQPVPLPTPSPAPSPAPSPSPAPVPQPVPVSTATNPYISIIRSYIQSQFTAKRITKSELQSIFDTL